MNKQHAVSIALVVSTLFLVGAATVLDDLTLTGDLIVGDDVTVTGDAAISGSVTGKLPIKALSAGSNTMSAAECLGTLAKVTTSATNVTLVLPRAVAGLHCYAGMVVAATFYIDPATTADQILLLTNSGGDRIRGLAAGNGIHLACPVDGKWVSLGEKGTWSDAN